MIAAMPDMRKEILTELERREWSHYQLVQALKGKRPGRKDVTPMTVYNFLAGKSTINSADLGLMFDVLGLEIKAKR